MTMSVLNTVLILFGYIFTVFLFISPMTTLKRIIRNRSTEEFSGIPYVMTLLNCLLYMWYGMPFISSHNYLTSILNGFGALIELVYVMIFLAYAPKRERIKITILLIFIIGVFSTVVVISFLVFHPTEMNYRHLLCGFSATTLSIITYASPLSVMLLVIETKSVEYMPFLPSLSIFLSSTTWLIYGFMHRNKYIYMPSGIGFVLGVVQLIIYAVYCKNKPTSTDEGERMSRNVI